jgi:hypothetical protein
MPGPFTNGDAIFSTRLGKYKPRKVPVPPPGVIVHGNSRTDVANLAMKLCEQFPEQTKVINQDYHWTLDDFWDKFDIHMHGPRFLASVIQELMEYNHKKIRDRAYQWTIANPFRLCEAAQPDATVESIFSESERAEADREFLACVLRQVHSVLLIDYTQQQLNWCYTQSRSHPYVDAPPQEVHKLHYYENLPFLYAPQVQADILEASRPHGVDEVQHEENVSTGPFAGLAAEPHPYGDSQSDFHGHSPTLLEAGPDLERPTSAPSLLKGQMAPESPPDSEQTQVTGKQL